eukprot:5686089-Alexandrium_andersonii.AAC.1
MPACNRAEAHEIWLCPQAYSLRERSAASEEAAAALQVTALTPPAILAELRPLRGSATPPRPAAVSPQPEDVPSHVRQ